MLVRVSSKQTAGETAAAWQAAAQANHFVVLQVTATGTC